ncbi:N-acetylmuramoyl-L-alanine amidase family protein [Clostridium sp.]|uniref:N-acetylmuramoyl-L-alanine amidase family protein n=1 Tax=Clostridium sp. TaxID=1506 RepID=UPI00284795CA|nr:N-acetylmuramoyl-L-alanine amidase family protein [Clostridium sp.]MDR3595701.1 N-acetylmuramoyl-L-alanine amidase family protein [Clostridium sp.]
MIKFKILKRILTSGIAIVGLVTFVEINGVKANAEGWVKVNNSWRYYSGPSIQTGWCHDNGAWYYFDEYGMAKTGWIKSEGRFYYLDPVTGKMLTGWIQDRGNWYYLNSSGEMVTGWLEYNGNLYYLNTSGVMVKDIYIGSYYLGPDGAWKEG